MSDKPRYTTVLHKPRESMGLTMNEYGIADSIHKLQLNGGWCIASKAYLGRFIGITERQAARIVGRLLTKGLVEKNQSRQLRITLKWVEAFEIETDKMSVSTQTKCPSEADKMSYNNNIYNNIYKENAQKLIGHYNTTFKRRYKLSTYKSQITARLKEHSYQELHDMITAYYNIRGDTWYNKRAEEIMVPSWFFKKDKCAERVEFAKCNKKALQYSYRFNGAVCPECGQSVEHILRDTTGNMCTHCGAHLKSMREENNGK